MKAKPTVSATLALALLAAMPGVRQEALEGQDHMGLRGAPEAVARLVGDLLAS